MESIRHYFEHIIQQKISDAEWKIFASMLLREEFPKYHTILNIGETETYLSFVESGIIRYYIPKIENDLTFAFAFAGHFASAYDSFLSRSPSLYAGQTLHKTILWRVTYTSLQRIYNTTKIGNTIGRFVSENLYINKFNRELSLLNDTAQQRYQHLLVEQPHLIQHIPLKYIASYIGVTPQALSRIRKRIY